MRSHDLLIDRDSEVPLGTQLAWKLRTLIATGAVRAGDRLPGIREVADAAEVNVNTVRSVFARLEEQGLIATERGRGTFVAADARTVANLAEVTHAAIAQARELGLDPRELAAALYVSPDQSPRVEGGGRAHRRALYDEIASLEREVARLDPLGTLERRKDPPAPRVLSLAELHKIRDELDARLGELHGERQQWRVEAEQEALAEAEHERASRAPRRSQAGIWTGRRAQVSWTSP